MLWPDSDDFFAGIVQAQKTFVSASGVVHAESYDVLYDELVGGQPCLEKNVSATRVFPAGTCVNVPHLREDSAFIEEIKEV